MGLLVRCIGIDRHRDNRVPDLTGARRDATALWALVADTLPDADSRLITDEMATADMIRRVVAEALGNASADDDVILTFAGHGTRDHRLVAHDTSFEAYQETTLSMAELAANFRATRARSVVCVLDCCFSGAAPARVLDETPVSRDLPIDPQLFLGAGRVMITASRFDEPAYEHPRRRHGLLTDALLTVLTRAGATGGGRVSLASAMDEVLSLVRGEAAGMGCTQTPVFLGLVEGGLSMPALVRGTRFREAFPEAVRPVIGPAIAGLAAYGMPPAALEAWTAIYPAGLNELQLAAVNDFGALAGDSTLIIAPTSGGKTLVGELAAVRAVSQGRKAVFLLPYRALVNEKYEQFIGLYGERLRLRVVRCTGDYADQRTAFVNGKYDLAVLTFEMFLALAVGNRGVLPRVGLVVLDEAQFIADPTRGITVELILTFLRAARERGVAPQVLALSATIGALNHFDEWLGLRGLVSDRRPVPLEFGVLDRTGAFEYLDAEGQRGTKQLLHPHAIRQRGATASSQDVVVPLVRQLLANAAAGEKVLIFRNQRGAAAGCANYLAREAMLPPAVEVIAALPTHDRAAASAALERALQGGAAFHNSDLTREERAMVERAFRDPDSPVRVLAATSGVAAGINTPASTVIIVEHGFPWEERDFSVGEVRNMGGRAGRLGFRETGRAILLAETPLERRQLFDRYVAAAPEPVTSSFTGSDVGTWLVRLFAQAGAVPEEAVVALLANTYGGYLATRRDPTWQTRTTSEVATLVERMLTLGLLERDGERVLHLTLLGQACGTSSLALSSALRLVELLRKPQITTLSPELLMVIVQALPELDGQYTPLFRRGQGEARWPREVAALYGDAAARLLQERAADILAYYARAKRACMLAAWIRGDAAAEIERQFTLNPRQGAVRLGDIRGCADTTRFHLRSAYSIAQIAIPGGCPEPEPMEMLLRQVETGLPEHALELVELPVPLARGEYLALAAAGLTTVSEIWSASREQLVSILGPARSGQLDAFRASTSKRDARTTAGAFG